MNEIEIPTNTCIWKCTYVKSKHTAKKVILYSSYVIVALSVIFAITYPIYTNLPTLTSVSGSAISFIFTLITSSISATGSFLKSIPWWIYVIGFVIFSIPAHSFIWCLKQDLTEEDRTHANLISHEIKIGNVITVIIIFIGLMYILPVCYNWGFAWKPASFTPDLEQPIIMHQINGILVAGVVGLAGSLFFGLLGLVIGDIIAKNACTLYHYYRRKKHESKTG